jgi:hypothetical protein
MPVENAGEGFHVFVHVGPIFAELIACQTAVVAGRHDSGVCHPVPT